MTSYKFLQSVSALLTALTQMVLTIAAPAVAAAAEGRTRSAAQNVVRVFLIRGRLSAVKTRSDESFSATLNAILRP
jgi:hypothetical protein